MRSDMWKAVLTPLLLAALAAVDLAGAEPAPEGGWSLENGVLRLTVTIGRGRLAAEKLERLTGGGPALASDGGFGLELMWTDWSAPGRVQNADNPVTLTAADFLFEKAETTDGREGRELRLRFHGDEKVANSLRLALVYCLEPGRFWVKRRLEVSDPRGPLHFLRLLQPLRLALEGDYADVKRGGFGQPVALQAGGGGAFFALEYPAADNALETAGGKRRVTAGQEIGERIGPDAIVSDWAVVALTPDRRVKHWFFEYLDSVRVAPLRPYTLYNSWYDLRSPIYPKITPDHVMNRANVGRIIRLLRDNMVEKHGIRLDAFVLDDGWDLYASDWELRRDQFPDGLKPISEELAKSGTRLGVWFGPTGGYSFRKERLAWMGSHGYETVGDQLCLAGKNYRALFQRRVLDFVEREGVGYFKWDGIQFSCSQPDHGHAVDLYSRRAVTEAVAELCRAARAADPDMFLNVTSGTWLSPWWLRFANQIWMGGEDYGWSEVPSLSPRDAAITYRDSVLYDDFEVQDLWFPIANLMTHGIIKGRLQMLGGENEPLEKFTDETVMYVARGVSMFELYVSPDLLGEGEWAAMSGALRWARDRFGLLRRTEMAGGDPRRGQAYGYVHADGSRGIVVVRNPLIEPQTVKVALCPGAGFAAGADRLVLERVYPTRYVDPKLRAIGEELEVRLDGFETAVYEVYPLEEAQRPLPAGVEFAAHANPDGSYAAVLYSSQPPGLLNAWPDPAAVGAVVPGPAAGLGAARLAALRPGQAEYAVEVPDSTREARLVMLLKPDPGHAGEELPAPRASLDRAAVACGVESEKGAWRWVSVPLPAGRHRVTLRLDPPPGRRWSGTLGAWLVGRVRQPSRTVTWSGSRPALEPPMPPSPWPEGEFRRQLRVGETGIAAGSGRGR